MSRIFLALLFVSVWMCGATAWAQSEPLIDESKLPNVDVSELEYIEALTKAMTFVVVVQAGFDVCAKRFPSSAGPAQTAARTFREKHNKLLVDLEGRFKVLWKALGENPAEFEAALADSRRAVAERVNGKLSALPIEKRVETCRQWVNASSADKPGVLESNLASELKVIRAHPVEVAKRKTK